MIDSSEKHNQTISIAVQDWCNGAAWLNPAEQQGSLWILPNKEYH